MFHLQFFGDYWRSAGSIWIYLYSIRLKKLKFTENVEMVLSCLVEMVGNISSFRLFFIFFYIFF